MLQHVAKGLTIQTAVRKAFETVKSLPATTEDTTPSDSKPT